MTATRTPVSEVWRQLNPSLETATNPTEFELWNSAVCVHIWYSAGLGYGGIGKRAFIKDLGKGLAVLVKSERATDLRGNPFSLVHDGLQHAVPVTAAEQLHAGS